MSATSSDRLIQAKREHAAAVRALEQIRAARTLPDLEESWRRFLHDANRVWSKLEAAAKAEPRIDQWLASHRSRRKSDPLLAYMLHARNSDEHTLTEVVSHQHGGIAINPATPGGSLHIRSLSFRMEEGGMTIDYDGSPAAFEVIDPHIRLERVYDRGVWYDPPASHLGTALTDRSPLSVAQFMLSYCDLLISEAEVIVHAAG